MIVSQTKHAIGRLAALFFLVGGGVSLVTVPLTPPAADRFLTTVISVVTLGIGIFTWHAPWHRWPRGATLWLVPVALALIAVSDPIGGRDPYVFGVYFVVVFAWIGVCHPPGTSLRFAVPAAVAYVAPLLLPGHGPTAVSSSLQIVPLCVLVGEALARVPTQLRRTEARDLERFADLQALIDASGALMAATDASRAETLAAELARTLLRADGAAVLLMQEQGTFVGAGASSWSRPIDTTIIERGTEPQLESAVQTGRPAIVHNRDDSSRLLRTSGWGSMLLLPLMSTSGPLGAVLVAYRRGNVRFEQFTSYMAETFATRVAMALERLQATRRLVEASMRDELTGLGNRRAGEVALRQLRSNDAVVLLDVDRLKEINDTHGHAAGDDALRALAMYLEDALREQDWAIRYGGDEFLLVLAGVGRNANMTVLRLADGWRVCDPASTFTAGVAVHEGGRTPAETLASADAALYEAKRAGRDRVMISPPDVIRA